MEGRMSERELRRLLKGRCVSGIEDALAAEPDVVVLLRFCYAQGTLAAARGHGDAANTFDDVIKEIEKTVRLTDDGWEWVK
jgi:hypothetical protein